MSEWIWLCAALIVGIIGGCVAYLIYNDKNGGPYFSDEEKVERDVATTLGACIGLVIVIIIYGLFHTESAPPQRLHPIPAEKAEAHL